MLRQAFNRPAYGGGNPSAEERLVWAYRFHRAMNKRDSATGRATCHHARTALEAARKDAAAGVVRYASTVRTMRDPTPPESNVFFESDSDATAAGFRLVGFSDDIVREIRHRGWYSDDCQHSTYRGVVFQLASGRRSTLRFVAGYHESDSGGYVVQIRGRGAVSEECVTEPYGTPNLYTYRETGDRLAADDLTGLGACRDAARDGDSFAEHAAEEQRDYDTAWQAGVQWSDAGEEIDAARGELREILAERRAAKRDLAAGAYAALCGAIRNRVSDLLDTVEELRNKRRDLECGDADGLCFYPDARLREAFNDGAGEIVL